MNHAFLLSQTSLSNVFIILYYIIYLLVIIIIIIIIINHIKLLSKYKSKKLEK